MPPEDSWQPGPCCIGKPACASERAGELALGTFAGILPDLDYIYYAIQNPFNQLF